MENIINEKLNLEEIENVSGGSVSLKPGYTKDMQVVAIRKRLTERRQYHWSYSSALQQELNTNALITNSFLTDEEITELAKQIFADELA